MKAKNQRLTLLVLAIAAVLAAILLGMSGLRDKAAFFYAPADVARQGAPAREFPGPPHRPPGTALRPRCEHPSATTHAPSFRG